jgi:hypothetical protein
LYVQPLEFTFSPPVEVFIIVALVFWQIVSLGVTVALAFTDWLTYIGPMDEKVLPHPLVAIIEAANELGNELMVPPCPEITEFVPQLVFVKRWVMSELNGVTRFTGVLLSLKIIW